MTETRYYAQIETRKTGRTGVYENDMTNWFAIYEVGVADAIEFHKLPYEANRNAAKTLRELGWELEGDLEYLASINVERGPVQRITEAPESPRVGERVTYKVGRRTVNATVTRLANEAGEVGVVADGDQTGSVRHVAPALLTVQAPDLDALHADAQREDELRTALAQSLAESESAPRFVVNQIGPNSFAVRDTRTELDVAAKSSRSGAQHIADCLMDGTMVLDSLGRAIGAQKPVVEGASDSTAEYGVFEDGECIETGYHGDLGRVAAGATLKAYTDDPARDGLTYEVKELCPDHEEQPKDSCEECFTEE